MNGNVTLVPALLTALRDIDADRINPDGAPHLAPDADLYSRPY